MAKIFIYLIKVIIYLAELLAELLSRLGTFI